MPKRQNEHMNLGEALRAFIEENRLQKGMDKVDARDAWVKLMEMGSTTIPKRLS